MLEDCEFHMGQPIDSSFALYYNEAIPVEDVAHITYHQKRINRDILMITFLLFQGYLNRKKIRNTILENFREPENSRTR